VTAIKPFDRTQIAGAAGHPEVQRIEQLLADRADPPAARSAGTGRTGLPERRPYRWRDPARAAMVARLLAAMRSPAAKSSTSRESGAVMPLPFLGDVLSPAAPPARDVLAFGPPGVGEDRGVQRGQDAL
jgi:hypothetical protein